MHSFSAHHGELMFNERRGSGRVGETSSNPVVIGDPSALPVVPSGKDFIQNPTTYCNPISLTQGSGRVLRGGEPVITMFEDDYYLFVSMQRGYWWSHDFVDWTYVDAPNFVGGIPGVVEIDGKLYGYAGNTNDRVIATDDPKTGIWYDVGTFSSNNYGDAAMLYDEETGRLFMYYGWSQLFGIRVVELDKTTFKEIGEPVVCIWGDPHNHGWETRYSDDLIFPYFDHREYRVQEYGWTEGVPSPQVQWQILSDVCIYRPRILLLWSWCIRSRRSDGSLCI